MITRKEILKFSNKYEVPATTIDLDWKKIKLAFITKIKFKNIKFNSIEDFFENRKLESVKKEWNNSLKNNLKFLPDVLIVLEELKMTLNSIWSK